MALEAEVGDADENKKGHKHFLVLRLYVAPGKEMPDI